MKNHHNFELKTKDQQKICFKTNFGSTLSEECTKDVLVFNYGLVCSNYHWKDQIQYFSQLDYPIITHNYRGHYNSTSKDDLTDINFKQLSEDLVEILQFLNISEKVVLLGHSMGVNVTLEFYRLFPHRVKKMVLISGTTISPYYTMFNSNMMSYLVPYTRNLSEKYPKIAGPLWKSSAKNPLLNQLVMHGGFNREVTSMDFVKVYLKRMSKLSMPLFFKLFEEMGQQDIINHLQEIRCPTLVIGGDKDKMIPNYYQHILIRNIPHSRLFVVKDAGHVPQIDFPDLVNKRLLQFLENDR